MLFYIKWAAQLEILLVIFLLVAAYAAKFYYFLKARNDLKNSLKINDILTKMSQEPNPKISKKISYFKKYISVLLKIIDNYDLKMDLPYWPQIRIILIETILKPQARKLANSRFWYKRYLGVRCFGYGIDQHDEAILQKLIRDKILLVSLNASLLVAKIPAQFLVDDLIDIYSQGRRLQQSIFSEEFAKTGAPLTALIMDRLLSETNPYIKSFCYNLLTKLPVAGEVPSVAIRDLNSQILDLKIAALKYLAHYGIKTVKIIRKYLHNENWQVRVVAIKLISELKDVDSIQSIGDLLRDSEWWVRMNAANALASMGEKGISILKAQDPKVDAFAYQVSQEVLKVTQIQKG